MKCFLNWFWSKNVLPVDPCPQNSTTEIMLTCQFPLFNIVYERPLKSRLAILIKKRVWVWSLIKTSNSTIFNIIRWVAGTKDSSTKRLIFQALFFFIISYRLRALKILYFNYKKINWNNFCKAFCKKLWKIKLYLEHQTLGPWVVCPSDPAYYIEDCRIYRQLQLPLPFLLFSLCFFMWLLFYVFWSSVHRVLINK